MRLDRAALVAAHRPCMGGDQLSAAEDLYRMGTQPRIDPLADQAVVHGVIAASHRHALKCWTDMP